MGIELSKDRPSVNLGKGDDAIHVHLGWTPKKHGGFLEKIFGGGAAADLDLGCMYEMNDGQKGVIQALGNSFGSKNTPPYILLDQDDRSGAGDGENLVIAKPSALKRVLIFTYIYDGSANFQSVETRVSLKTPNGEEVYMNLSSPGNLTFCALALVTCSGSQVTVTRQEKYFRGHQECDQAFGFGFEWTVGHKD